MLKALPLALRGVFITPSGQTRKPSGSILSLSHSFSPSPMALNQASRCSTGTYTFSETGETRAAQLLFKDEYLFQVMGFKGTTTAGDASEITPNPGDTFTISYKWLDTLTFGSQPFQWKQEWLPSGDYLIGFLVADLDGNVTPVYTNVTVQ